MSGENLARSPVKTENCIANFRVIFLLAVARFLINTTRSAYSAASNGASYIWHIHGNSPNDLDASSFPIEDEATPSAVAHYSAHHKNLVSLVDASPSALCPSQHVS